MSYEYNHSIQFDLDHLSQYEDVVELEKKKNELDHVYAQAAKADEYEAKAKAFDEICGVMNFHYPTEHDRKHLNAYQHPKASLRDIDDIIKKIERSESECLKMTKWTTAPNARLNLL